MHTEIQLINEMREEAMREVEMNRLAKASRKSERRDSDSPFALLARELKLDLFRLVGVFGGFRYSKGKGRKARS